MSEIGLDDLRNSFLVKLVEDLTQRPSYKSKMSITIIEKLEALEKVKRSWIRNDSVNVKLQSELSSEIYDLVVFGSFRADNELKTFASSNCKNSINLGFFDEIACFNF